jgi:hypothetical protein
VNDDPTDSHRPADSNPAGKPPAIFLVGEEGWLSGSCPPPAGRGADRSGQARAALMTGPAGWNSGPMPGAGPGLTIANVIAAHAHRGWEIAQTGQAAFTAEYRDGSRLHVLAGHSAAELDARIRAAEAAWPGPDPASLLARIAGEHPTWAVDAADHGRGVTATRGDVHLWACDAAELAALLDVADPMVP